MSRASIMAGTWAAVVAVLMGSALLVHSDMPVQAAPPTFTPHCSSAQLLIRPINRGLGAAAGTVGRWYRLHELWGGDCRLRGNPRSCMSIIFATADGGRTWMRQLTLPRSCGQMQVGMLDARRGWAVGGMDTRYCSMGGCDDYALYRTVDGGKHWTTELAPSQKWWVAGGYAGGFPGPPVLVTPRYGWIPFGTGAGPGAGGIAITTDGGRTWRRVLAPYPLAASSVSPINTHDGWIAGLSRLCPSPSCNADLLHTTDGGRTWAKLHPQP